MAELAYLQGQLHTITADCGQVQCTSVHIAMMHGDCSVLQRQRTAAAPLNPLTAGAAYIRVFIFY